MPYNQWAHIARIDNWYFLAGLRASLVAQPEKNPLQCRIPQSVSQVWKILWRRNRLPTPVFLCFLHGSDGKQSWLPRSQPVFHPWVGQIPRRGRSNPLQYSGLENTCGDRSLTADSLWCHKESDTTAKLSIPETKIYFCKKSAWKPWYMEVWLGKPIWPWKKFKKQWTFTTLLSL